MRAFLWTRTSVSFQASRRVHRQESRVSRVILTKLDAIPQRLREKGSAVTVRRAAGITFAKDRDRYLRITGQLYRPRETFRLFATGVEGLGGGYDF